VSDPERDRAAARSQIPTRSRKGTRCSPINPNLYTLLYFTPFPQKNQEAAFKKTADESVLIRGLFYLDLLSFFFIPKNLLKMGARNPGDLIITIFIGASVKILVFAKSI
jgi:hypothetical protein